MRFINFLREAFALLIKEPKLFLPKILLTAFLSAIILIGSFIAVTNADVFLLASQPEAITPDVAEKALFVMTVFLILMLCMIVALVFDIITNGMYPILVSDFYNKRRLSLKRAFRESLRNASRVLPAGIALYLLVFIPFSIYIVYASVTIRGVTELAFVILTSALVGAFLIYMLFYFLYPAIMLTRNSVLQCIKNNLALVKRNVKTVILATVIPFISTLISFGFAVISAFEPWFLIVFFIYRLLSTCLFTYHMVLNPTIYLKVQK
ncbi:MAG: hypothetical protein J7L44_04070 [Candidatus Diapherotrites archaeon]|nr:hypothetical protein [Candidatus Diapherotrites archaeon]